jgi:hypothetical protein
MNKEDYYFTQENTEGFSQESLDKMNALVDHDLEDVDFKTAFADSIAKGRTEKIFNVFC